MSLDGFIVGPDDEERVNAKRASTWES